MRHLGKLLDLLYGRMCFCGTRTRDLDAHHATFHTRQELDAQEAMKG